MTEHALKMDSPIGPLWIVSNGEAITAIHTAGFEPESAPELVTDPVLERARAQLVEYFAGTCGRFDLPLAPRGTSFQQKVWAALCEIPAGVTESYGGLARRLGNAGASRAVGLANSRNPIAIVVPCHRVIGANGSLTGYAGGLELKRWLLAHEARWAPQASTTAATRSATRARAVQTAFALESDSPRQTTTSSSGAARNPSAA